MGLAPETQRFMSAPIRYVDTGSATVAYRQFGAAGEPLVLLHGWPFAGSTFRRLVPLLEQRFTCYVPDLPGAGDSPWTDATDFSFDGRARIVADFVGRLGLSRYSLVGHDTGGHYGLLEVTAPAGAPGPPPHVHEREEEALYVVDGELDVQIAERTLHARAGTFALVPRGAPRNNSRHSATT